MKTVSILPGVVAYVGAAALFSIWLTGCSLNADAGDRVTLTGTPKGLQAFADFSNGLIRTGKEEATQSSEYFAHRRTQETQETARKGQAVGFWQRLAN